MAGIPTITLSHGSGASASINEFFVDTAVDSRLGQTYQVAFKSLSDWSQGKSFSKITPLPTNSNPSKVFAGYYNGSVLRVRENGNIRLYNSTSSPSVPLISSDETWTAQWDSVCPTASISANGGTGGTVALYYDASASKWFKSYPFADELSASSPIAIPTRTQHQFLGCYAENNATSTKYINADGTPTAAFLALAPTNDLVIYAQWRHVSHKVTVVHEDGSPSSTAFYAKIGETGADRFFADELCTTVIHSITPPLKELFRWDGAFSSSSKSAATTYINSSGEFQPLLYGLSISSDLTIYYADYWTQVSHKISLAGTGWGITTPSYYVAMSGGVYADWLCETEALDRLPVPPREAWRFLGYYSTNATTGTRLVDGGGLISSELKAAANDATIYAQGRAASCTLTLDANGGTGGTTIYYDATSGDAAFFGPSSEVITSVTQPTYTGNAFYGYFTAATGGTQVINAQGEILTSWVPTANATVYAQWGIDVSIIDVDAGEGSGGTTRFWYRGTTRKFYGDSELTTEITSVTLPTKELFDTTGLYDDGGVLRVASSGVISAWTPTGEFVALHAQYSRRCYAVVLSAGGGSGSLAAIYRAPAGTSWYSDDALTQPVTNVGVPSRTGYTFNGFTYAGATVVDASGDILSAAVKSEDYAATAAWNVRTFVLSFNYAGGTPGISSKTVTFGTAVGNLPTTSKSGATLDGWYVSGEKITSSTVYTWGENVTAYARFDSFFGNVTDYFGLASSWLVPESSDSGDNRQRVAVRHYGKTESCVDATSGVWRNPTVTYRVTRTGYLSLSLGRAFYGSYGVSGYMITSVSVATKLGEFPTVTVSATANEGRDAINSFPVTLQILGRARPQNLMSAVSGGGDLQELTLTASCDPVVVAENMMPCASDVVNGRIVVNATTGAYLNQSEPTASGGFVQLGAAASCGGTAYKFWRVNLIKEI